MRIAAIFLFFLIYTVASAQRIDSVKITGHIQPDSGYQYVPDRSDFRLVPFNEDESVYLEKANNDGTFNITVGIKGIGYYELKFKNYKMALLLSPAEPVYQVIIKTDAQQQVKSMKITGSKENDAYRLFRREELGLKDVLRDFKTECAGDGRSCLAKYKKQMAAQNELMDYLKIRFKGTYTAGVLAALGYVPDLSGPTTVATQMQKGFFEATDFADSSLYLTPDLTNKLSWYLDFIADSSATGRLSFINSLMEKTSGKFAAQKGLLTTLFNLFLDEYREPYIASLVQWSNKQPGLNNTQPVMAAKIKLVSNVLDGGLAPDVTGENLTAKTQNLLSTAKQNKLTLLIFWESDCPHCRKSMPEFVRLYKQYHTKGLEVFAASLDTDKTKWKSFIDANHLNWNNIVLPEGSSAHADYFIQYTPTVVLINGKGQIVRRFISVEDLDKAISEQL